MTNHVGMRASGLLLATGTVLALSGCVAAVVPIAAGGMVGKKALFGHRPATPPPAAAGTAAVPPPPPAREAPRTVEDREPPPAVKLVPPSPPAPTAAAPAPAAAVATVTWDGIARTMAKMASRVPDHLKVDVLQSRADAPDTLCGPRRPAVAIDAATLGSGDYLYVGALYTMGFEVVLMSPLEDLPAGQIAALRKQGIAAPVRGKTLFPNYPGSERTTRLALARQYCVVGLVGDHAGDFPDGVLPGTPRARDGWFLVARR